jgi:hypothetical protein
MGIPPSISIPKEISLVPSIITGSMTPRSRPIIEKRFEEIGKSKYSSPNLGLQQKPLKKGTLDKPLKASRKKNQEKFKLIGESSVESESVRTIDLTSPNLGDDYVIMECEGYE